MDAQKNTRCGSCRKIFTLASLREEDGYCPYCGQPVDEEEGEEDEY